MSSQKKTLLIVEDDDEVLAAVFGFVKVRFPDVDVHTAGSAEEGLELFAEYKPNIVLSDYRLPGMDGISMLVQMRQQEKNLRIAVMTAYVDLNVSLRAINDANVDAFLTKPFHPAILEEKLSFLLARRDQPQEELTDDSGQNAAAKAL